MEIGRITILNTRLAIFMERSRMYYHKISTLRNLKIANQREKIRSFHRRTILQWFYLRKFLILHIKYWSTYLYGRNLCLTHHTGTKSTCITDSFLTVGTGTLLRHHDVQKSTISDGFCVVIVFCFVYKK